MRKLSWATFLASVIALTIDTLSFGQGLRSTPYAADTFLRQESLDFRPGPSGPMGSQSPFFTKSESSSKRDIPNLQMGYEFYTGKNWRVGYFTLDYLLPMRMTENSIVFGEAHSELQCSSTNLTRRADEQVFLSFGGGYRKVLRGRTLLGLNCFYDTARFANRWVSSGGMGLEIAHLIAGSDALDTRFNWYGDLAEGDLVNQYRNGPANFDLQVGYSHQLFYGGPDLRLFSTIYNFDDESGVLGWQAGGELKSPDGVVSIKGETGHDPVNGSYQSVSAFVNIGFQVENLAQGKNPFVTPEPIFSSPRNMNRLTHKVTRNHRHTTYGISVLKEEDHTRVIKIVNNTSQNSRTIYVKMQPGKGVWGFAHQYSPKYFTDQDNRWKYDSNNDVLYAKLDVGDSILMTFGKPTTDPNGKIPVTISMDATTGCALTQAEFTLHDYWGTNFNPPWKDTYDISLVQGFNYSVKVEAPYPDKIDEFTPINPKPLRTKQILEAHARTANNNNPGVFGFGNDQCHSSCAPPQECCAFSKEFANEGHPAYDSITGDPVKPAHCEAGRPYAPCPGNNPAQGNLLLPAPKCQLEGWHPESIPEKKGTFVVTFCDPGKDCTK